MSAKNDFIALKAEIDKLDINKLTNVPTSLNNFQTKVDDLDVGKFNTVRVDLTKTGDIVDNEVVKKTKFNTLKTKVNNLEKKSPNATTLIHIYQYNVDKQNLKKKIGNVDKKIPDTNGLVTTTIFNTKISEVDKKIPDASGLVTTTVLNTKFSEVDNKITGNSKYITTQEFNKLTAEKFTARLKHADLVNKTDFDNKLTSFNKRITPNKTKNLEVQKKLNSLITKDYNFFLGRIYFESNDRYRLIAVDLSRQKELDADPKATQQIEFVGQLKKTDANGNATDAGNNDESTFVLTILEKIKETRLKFSQENITVL